MKYLLAVVVSLLLGISLSFNFLVLKGKKLFSKNMKLEQENKNTTKEDQSKENKHQENKGSEYIQKYNSLVSKYNMAIEIYEKLKKENLDLKHNLDQKKAEVVSLEEKLKIKPKVQTKIVKEFVKKECPAPRVVEKVVEVPVKPVEIVAQVKTVKPQKLEELEIVDETNNSNIGLEEVKTDFDFKREYQSEKVVHPVKKEDSCILAFKEKLAKSCLKRTKQPVEILEKNKQVNGSSKVVYYCREVSSKNVVGTFSSGPSEARTYCYMKE